MVKQMSFWKSTLTAAFLVLTVQGALAHDVIDSQDYPMHYGVRLAGTSWVFNGPKLADLAVWGDAAPVRVTAVNVNVDKAIFSVTGTVTSSLRDPNESLPLKFKFHPDRHGNFAGRVAVTVRSFPPGNPDIYERTTYFNLSGGGGTRDWRIVNTTNVMPDPKMNNGDFTYDVYVDFSRPLDHDFSETALCGLFFSHSPNQVSGIVPGERSYIIGGKRCALNYKKGRTKSGHWPIKLPGEQTPRANIPANAPYVLAYVEELPFDSNSANNVSPYSRHGGQWRVIEDVKRIMVEMTRNGIPMNGSTKLQQDWMQNPRRVAAPWYWDSFHGEKTSIDFTLPKHIHSKSHFNGHSFGRDWMVKGATAKDAVARLLKRTFLRKPKARRKMEEEVNRLLKLKQRRLGKKVKRVLFGQKVPSPGKSERYFAQSIQKILVGKSIDDPDLAGSFGSFHFYAIPRGKATRKTVNAKRGQVSFSEVFVVALDAFDFEDISRGQGDQELGYWPLLPPRLIHNSDYRLWRNLTGRGQDRYLVSQPKKYTFNPPITFPVEFKD